MKQILVKFTLGLVLCLVNTYSHASQEKLVLVGGVNEGRLGQCSSYSCDDGSEYNWGYLKWSNKLGNALNTLDNLIPKYNQYEFRWSGDPVTHEEDGSNLKTKFENWFYNNVCSRGSECNVSFISHSWGTIISSDFIASLPNSTSVNIRTVVTYASPVTGAQIKWNVDPFWETAVTKAKNIGATWINIVNPKDVIAWNIPGTLNYKPDGTVSLKGRLNEIFPVSNSEMDPQYLTTSVLRQCNPIQSSFCSTLGDNLSDIWTSNTLEPQNIAEWNQYFADTHFTENYEPNRLIGYIKSNLPNSIKPYFDGTGSLIDPQHNDLPKGCDGCERDYVKLHSHGNQTSAGFFQVTRILDVCEAISLEGLGSASVEVRSWSGRGTDSSYYNVSTSSNVIPLKSNDWNLILFNTNIPIPVGTTKTVKATCLSSNSNISEVNKNSIGFDNNYFWGGNGSLINHTNNQYNRDTQAGYGRDRDTVVLLSGKKTLSVFQATHSSSCNKLKFKTPVAFNLSWKLWDEKNWRGNRTISNGDSFTFPTNDYWWILKVKAPAVNANSRIDATCE